jgi:hypothetical protein
VATTSRSDLRIDPFRINEVLRSTGGYSDDDRARLRRAATDDRNAERVTPALVGWHAAERWWKASAYMSAQNRKRELLLQRLGGSTVNMLAPLTPAEQAQVDAVYDTELAAGRESRTYFDWDREQRRYRWLTLDHQEHSLDQIPGDLQRTGRPVLTDGDQNETPRQPAAPVRDGANGDEPPRRSRRPRKLVG